MSTTIHLPADLLAAVDRQARGLDMSRNRYIVRALERALANETQWSAEFVDELAAARADVGGRRALAGTARHRRRESDAKESAPDVKYVLDAHIV